MWGEGKKENRCPNIYIVSDIGEKKDQWESFNPENAKGLSLTCWWGFSVGSACCCVMFGWLPWELCCSQGVPLLLCTQPGSPVPWAGLAWHSPSGEGTAKPCEAELLCCSGNVLLCVCFGSWLCCESWASTETRNPPCWEWRRPAKLHEHSQGSTGASWDAWAGTAWGLWLNLLLGVCRQVTWALLESKRQ